MNQIAFIRIRPSQRVNERLRLWSLVVAVLATILCVGVVFGVETGAESPEPVSFDDTVQTGLTLEDEYSLLGTSNVVLPRVQTFYSQYEYVVGYYGVDTYVDAQRQAGHDHRFGYPIAIYVTDYGDTGIDLNDDGYPIVERDPGWTDAEEAWYVVDSDARTPSEKAVPSFADRSDAESFAESHGGEVLSWAEIVDTPFETDDASSVRDRVDEQNADADELVNNSKTHDERPVSVVVGEDVDNVQEGINEAPENTTVLVPEGTYNETLQIDRPITLAGDGNVTIRGDEDGSVVTVTTSDVSVRDLSITGVGTLATGAEELPGEVSDEWDDDFLVYYGGADAGVSAHVADDVLIEDVDIETPANGVILRDSNGAVVRNVTVREATEGDTGYAGVMALRSPGIIENSTITDGRDTVYLYRSPGMVVRNNEIGESDLGVHLMHTDRALLADNRIRNVENTGIYIMTGPVGNAIVGNEISNSSYGASVGGSDSYVAENVFEANDYGLRMAASASIYEHNVFAGNDVGARDAAVLPTNRVVRNDFVGNEDHAIAGAGPLRIWSYDGDGNYWQGGTSLADGTPPKRPYSPTDPVDGRLHDVDGAETLARAPALDALSGLEQSVSGMQTKSIVDLSPACGPNNPELIERTAWAEAAYSCNGTVVTD
ncbi:NosD domain-containing protein [Halopiger aswanensis]|uniref:Nitrous oxidase accessory protein NosD n=1 Tax=Halopiger aswanensis TaxID=148449 RepID=A0A3R7KIW9_9EURY|nr:NosD domain-containing protein [Halopiger aswanensis]RKD88979.1 nitrous oxidase accessory protein NosD [Halopiger aswanensis]